jgi:hypothetical protein
MSSLKEMKGIKPRVKWLLQNHPHLRDDDNKLIANVWNNEIHREATAIELLKWFAEGKLTSPDSITRVRRKLQEQNPNLRGVKYLKRSSLKEEIRQNIHDL